MKRVGLFALWWMVMLVGLATTAVWAQAPAHETTILDRDQAGTIMPATVFFRGQTASIQARNSAGLKFADGKLLLAAIVDTSGYSSGIQAKYQAYLLTEQPVLLAGQRLPAGAYGFGFVGDRMTVMDLGAHDLLSVPTAHDATLKRPTPLQMLPAPNGAGEFRLYLGREYVTVRAAS